MVESPEQLTAKQKHKNLSDNKVMPFFPEIENRGFINEIIELSEYEPATD